MQRHLLSIGLGLHRHGRMHGEGYDRPNHKRMRHTDNPATDHNTSDRSTPIATRRLFVAVHLGFLYTAHMIQPGLYRHYKGHEYEVLGVACHSETEEEYVVYRALYGNRGLWIRPRAMFLETVIVDGRPCPRFQFLAVS